MNSVENPFVYEAAINLPDDLLLDYYIEDFNYSRFLESSKNVFLVGERGSGKTMTLLYNSFRIKRRKAQREGRAPSLEHIGVYVPCNTPLTLKREYELLNPLFASVISEHFLVLSMAHALTETLDGIPEALDGVDQDDLRSELEFVFGSELPRSCNVFEGVKRLLQRDLVVTQQLVNQEDFRPGETRTFSFASVVVPILGITRKLPLLGRSHFSLMMDDAHALNEYQSLALNSWIAYRDHSTFSFKVATTRVAKRVLKTATGGSILEGHDYLRVDMEQLFQNEASDFGHLARHIVARRLERSEISAAPEEFLPESEQVRTALKKAESFVRQEAVKRYGKGAGRQIADHVYKFKRARFFRERAVQANRPQYSGFATLVYLSTGVIRNLLEPCYWMYDKMLSLAAEDEGGEAFKVVTVIPAHIQADVILERSSRLWNRLKEGLDYEIEGCSATDATRAFNLLDQLAVLFRERLLRHRSEPTANSFTISGTLPPDRWKELLHVMEVLRKAQYLYVRSGSAKEKGGRETYYVPNRMLWPDRGLDPYGQHARVSIQAPFLWKAAAEARPIPSQPQLDDGQREIWQ